MPHKKVHIFHTCVNLLTVYYIISATRNIKNLPTHTRFKRTKTASITDNNKTFYKHIYCP
jgi:hypothetical protein